MKILVIERDDAARDFCVELLRRFGRHHLRSLTRISYDLPATDYDVVIVDSHETQAFITDIPFNRIIVTTDKPSTRRDGSWALSKPYFGEELLDIVDVIRDSSAMDRDRANCVGSV